jgi:TRAP transporter TAXI family solute receptor
MTEALPKQIVATALAGAFLFAAGAADAGDEAAPAAPAIPETEIVIGGGNAAGLYFPAAGAICGVVTARNPGYRCLVESNANSSANLERLHASSLDFAVVQSDWLMHAARGTNLFRARGPDEELRAVLSLHAESLTLIARAGAGIDSVADLVGKRFNVGPELTYQRVLSAAMLRAFGIDDDELSLATILPAAEQFGALCVGELDALAMVVAHPSPVVAEALLRCDLRLVPVAGEALEDLLEDRPELSSAIIPGGLYAGMPAATPTFGLRAVLATRRQVDDAIVYEVVRAVAEALPELALRHKVLAGLDAGVMATAGIAAPLHDGAMRYYREQGLVR